MKSRLVVAALAAALAASAGCASLKNPAPFGDVESTRPSKDDRRDSGAYHGIYVPGAVVGT